MTELDEVAQTMYDQLVAERVPRWKLPATRDGWFKWVYERMPEESYNIMHAIADIMMSLMRHYPESQKGTFR